MKTKSILERIIKTFDLSQAFETLTKRISWSDLNTFLLSVFESRVNTITPEEVMNQYSQDRLVALAPVDPRALLGVETQIYNSLPAYVLPIELSPVNVTGLSSVISSINPKVVLSTIRKVDVSADPTSALALECAKRRKIMQQTGKSSAVHLAASQRTLRLQSFTPESGFTAHFKTFAITSAGSDTGHQNFELGAMMLQIIIWIETIFSCSRHNYKTSNVCVAISEIRLIEQLVEKGLIARNVLRENTQNPNFRPFEMCNINLPPSIESVVDLVYSDNSLDTFIYSLRLAEEKVVNILRKKFPDVQFLFDLERCAGIGYYSGLCYKITATNQAGETYPLADGGKCDWTQKLLNKKSEQLFTGGFGTELFARKFMTE